MALPVASALQTLIDSPPAYQSSMLLWLNYFSKLGDSATLTFEIPLDDGFSSSFLNYAF